MDYKDYNENLMKVMGELAKEIPETMQGFNKLHDSSVKTEKISGKTKQLIALGIAITVRCNGCISFHIHEALEAGASREEIVETIGVAVMMGGGPSVVYGTEAFEALNQFQNK
ncbi:MAG: carboxymuconolactone decarboxylase family protein [Bacteroidota bacterium]